MRKRKATQQMVVYEILRGTKRPLLPIEILNIGLSEGRRLSIATIYRALRSLLDSQEVIQIFIGNESPSYELISTEHHHHFFCRKCKVVYDITGCIGDCSLEKMLPRNFKMEMHEITLHGLCNSCSIN